MICSFPDHECHCKRTAKDCELYTGSLDSYVVDTPTTIEIIETASPEPAPVTLRMPTTVEVDEVDMKSVGYTPIKKVRRSHD